MAKLGRRKGLKIPRLYGHASSILAGSILACNQPVAPNLNNSPPPSTSTNLTTWSYATSTIESPNLDVACFGNTVVYLDSASNGKTGVVYFQCATPISPLDTAFIDSMVVKKSPTTITMVSLAADTVINYTSGDTLYARLHLREWGNETFIYGNWSLVKQ